MNYVESAAPQELTGIVRCIWHLSGDASEMAGAEPALPDGSPEFIVNLGEPFEYAADDGQPVRQPDVFLVGQITRPWRVQPTGRVELIAARFEAHGASLLYQPMRDLTDRWREFDAFAGKPVAALVEALSQTKSIQERGTHLCVALAQLRSQAPPPDPRVEAAVRAIRATNGNVVLDELAEGLGLTLRTLQRRFASNVGITPKMLVRIVRFQRVFQMVRQEPASLAGVAAECGYFDQSHMVRDFRDFAGEAPAKLLSAMPEFTAFFTA